MTTGRINQVTESCVLPLGRSHAALLSFNAGPLCSPVHNIAPQIQELPALAPNIRPCPPNYRVSQHCPRGEPRPRYEIATPIAQQRDSDKEQVLRVCKSMTWICGRVSTKSCERNCTAALLESKCTMDPTQHAKTCCLSPSQRGRGPPGPFPGITSCRTRLRTCQSTTTNPTTPSTRKGYAQPTHLDLL